MICLFCTKESVHEKRVPNTEEMCGLCDEHYNSKTSGEILERWRKKDQPVEEVVIGYCLKCKSMREMIKPEQETMKNGTIAWVGKCSACNGKVFKMIKRKS